MGSPISSINSCNFKPSPIAADAALLMLSRHQVRRRQGIPTVSVLVCQDAAGSRSEDRIQPVVGQWAELERRRVCEQASVEPADALGCWFAALNESRNVAAAAYCWLANRAGCDARRLAFDLRMRSPQERTLFLDRTLGTKNVPPADAVCRAVVENSCQDSATTVALWQRLLDLSARDLFTVTAGILALVGEEGTPILHFAATANDASALSATIAKAVSLASISPVLPIVVSATPERLQVYLMTTSECRTLALVREGIIWLADSRSSEFIPRVGGEDVRFGINSVLRMAERAEDDRARSAAERYLFERLQTHPATTGLFELNGLLELAGVERTLEVDLLARRVQVAVEIDGYYHFTDLDAYRRDRQKDLLLQRAGYFIVRCLAEDVASRLEEILEAIVAAVRRLPLGQGRGGERRG